MLKSAVKWYHLMTGHSGQQRLRLSIQQRFYHRELCKTVDNSKCHACQKHKLYGAGYGLLPERELKSVPCEEVAVDLTGPWTVQTRGRPYTFNALAIIDTVTNLVEIVRIDKKTSQHVVRKYDQVWLSRYPWPDRCVHDNGGEFTGWVFQDLLKRSSQTDVPTTSYNPQANSVCKQMHQTVGNVLRTLVHEDHPRSTGVAKDLADKALSIAQHAMSCSVHTTLGSSPGLLVFNRDMFLNIPLVADWHLITTRREQLVNENL